jgi:chemotaxis response regulator CheB
MIDESRIKVMLVDDHAVVRSGLSAFLSVISDLELVGEAENGDEAVRRCGLLQPDDLDGPDDARNGRRHRDSLNPREISNSTLLP